MTSGLLDFAVGLQCLMGVPGLLVGLLDLRVGLLGLKVGIVGLTRGLQCSIKVILGSAVALQCLLAMGQQHLIVGLWV